MPSLTFNSLSQQAANIVTCVEVDGKEEEEEDEEEEEEKEREEEEEEEDDNDDDDGITFGVKCGISDVEITLSTVCGPEVSSLMTSSEDSKPSFSLPSLLSSSHIIGPD